jgi:hypothetical protein
MSWKPDWKSDWNEFENAESKSPPLILGDRVLATVYADFHPRLWRVFSKLALIHALTGALTLSLCPQFGLRLFGEGMGLMGTFMKLGDYGCMVACGFVFLGMTLLIAAFVLRPEEVRAIRNHRILGLACLSMLSLGVFIMADAEIVIGFAAAWALGSIMGGAIALELVWNFRTRQAF